MAIADSSAIPQTTPLTHPRTATYTLPALTGVRFLAVFHIFMFHLWSIYDLDKPDQFATLMIGFANMPAWLHNYFANGWLSTSFFFVLSGFILAYLYWGPDGALSLPKKTFWRLRFARIYPIHIALLLVVAVMAVPIHLSNGMSVAEMIISALANAALVQAWYPPFVPLWSWPTWALSALVFLYLLTPWLMRAFGSWSRRQMVALLATLPLISLIPTAIYAVLVPAGTEPALEWTIFLGSTPLFWVPHFVAGMLLSRLFGISRFNPQWRASPPTWFAWGDLALVSVVVIACLPPFEGAMKYFLRHGLLLPVYLLIIFDLARGRGLAARLFSLPGTGVLGETAFSIFIWQNLVMAACWFSLMVHPDLGFYHLWVAPPAMVAIALMSTYWIEKPIARRLRPKPHSAPQ